MWQVEKVGKTDKNYNGESRVNHKMLKSRNNHKNEESDCDAQYCQPYTAKVLTF
jgi:hypothetical protein